MTLKAVLCADSHRVALCTASLFYDDKSDLLSRICTAHCSKRVTTLEMYEGGSDSYRKALQSIVPMWTDLWVAGRLLFEAFGCYISRLRDADVGRIVNTRYMVLCLPTKFFC